MNLPGVEHRFRGKEARVACLLDLAYLLLLAAAAPRLAVARACAKANIAKALPPSSWEQLPSREGRSPLRLAARRQRGRSELAGHADRHVAPAPAGLAMRRLDDHHDRLRGSRTRNIPTARCFIVRSISVGPCGGRWRRIRPRCLVLAELELWPNLIAAATASRGPRGGYQRPA